MNVPHNEEKYTDPYVLAQDWYMSNVFGMCKPAETIIMELGTLIMGIFDEGALAQTNNFTLKAGQALTFQKPQFLIIITDEQSEETLPGEEK